jgi:hypothetical protein
MDEAEIRAFVIERVLSNIQDRWVERQIEDLLRRGGSVGKALALCGKGNPPYGSIGSRIGNWGSYCRGEVSIQAYGSAPNVAIRVWGPECTDHRFPPDLVITWREVFEAVWERTVAPKMEGF